MHPLINEILNEMKDEFGITKYELERMVDCQFKCLEENIKDRTLKTVNLIYLGKVGPTGWFKYNSHLVTKYNISEDETKTT